MALDSPLLERSVDHLVFKKIHSEDAFNTGSLLTLNRHKAQAYSINYTKRSFGKVFIVSERMGDLKYSKLLNYHNTQQSIVWYFPEANFLLKQPTD